MVMELFVDFVDVSMNMHLSNHSEIPKGEF